MSKLDHMSAYGMPENVRHPEFNYPFSVSVLQSGDLIVSDCYKNRDQAMANAAEHITAALKGKNSYTTEYCNYEVIVLVLIEEGETECALRFTLE